MDLDPSLALTFLNTSAPAGGGPDLWAGPHGVRDWLADARLVDDPRVLAHLTPPEERLLLDDALRLRRALGELVEAWTSHARPASGMALLELNRLLDARPRRKLVLTAGTSGFEVRDHVVYAAAAGFMARVAEAGALLLANGDPTRVRRCASPGCARWFMDTSKNQRRRWCSMAVCGNRAKVAAHHRRSTRAKG